MTADSTPRPRGRRHNGLDAANYTAVGDVDPRVGEHLLDVLYLYGIAAYLQPSVSFDAALRSVRLPAKPIDQLWVDGQRTDEARRLVAAEAAEAGTTVGSSGEPDHDAAERSSTSDGAEADADGGPDHTGQRPQADSGDLPTRTPIGIDEEAAWRQLVEAFNAEPSPAEHPWPAAEDIDPPNSDAPGRSGTGSDTRTGGPSGSSPTSPTIRDAPRPTADRRRPRDVGRLPRADETIYFRAPIDDPRFDPDADSSDPDHEETFVPPPPPPLPRVMKHTAASVLAILVGALLLFWPSLIGLGPSLSFGLGILAIVAGVAVLVWRMRDPEDGDRPDDGAVV